MRKLLGPFAAMALSIPASAQRISPVPPAWDTAMGTLGQPGIIGQLPAGWANGVAAPAKVMPEAGVIDAAPREEAFAQGSISEASGSRRVIGEENVIARTVEAVDAAQDRVDFAYPSLLSKPAVVEALSRAARRGVEIRVILDGRRETPSGAQKLADAGVKVRIPYFSDLDSARFAVFDGQKAEVGIAKEKNAPNAGALFSSDPAYVGSWGQFFKHLTADAEGAW